MTLLVAMPFKNAEEFIASAVDSILTQTHTEFTLLAVDDTSTDRSTDILNAIPDRRVKVIPNKGTGISDALNTALAHTPRARFTTRHDADDRSHPDRFAKQLDYLRTNPDVTVLSTDADLIDRAGTPVGTWHTPQCHHDIVQAFKKANPICHGSVMMRTKPVLAAGGYHRDYPCAQDYELWVRLANHQARFANLPEPLYQYRTYEKSWSRSQGPRYDALTAQITATAALFASPSRARPLGRSYAVMGGVFGV